MRILFSFLLLFSQLLYAADEIHFTIKSPTAVTFSWRGAETQITYGTVSGSFTNNASAATPSIVPTSSSGPWKEAAITGLTANTTYYYKIGDSAEYSFKTPPAAGTEDFNIYALGNIGTSLRYPLMFQVQDLIGTDTPSFVLALGDLGQRCADGKLCSNRHFDDVLHWSTKAAYMPVWGDMDWATNTKEDFRNYKGRFDVPNSKTSTGSPLAGGKDWYWFDYGNTRFVTLPDITWQGSLVNWLINASVIMDAAQSDANIKHIVTATHRPAYTSGYYLASKTLKEAIDALGDTYNKYQLNLAAHSGGYERSSAQHGVTHVTVGTGGSDMQQVGVGLWATVSQPAWSVFRAMHLGALKLNFMNAGITGTFRCGPAGGGTNDMACDYGTTLDTFYIPVIPDDPQPNPGPTLTSIASANITQTQADVSWACNEPCTGQVNYGTTTGYGLNTLAEPSFNYSAHNQHLTGLTAGTTYHYRVRSTNNNNVETVSSDNTFETLAATPIGPTLTGFSATNLSTTGATLNWSCGEPCTGWYELGTTTAYGITNNPGQNDYTYSAHSQVKTGLTENTLYHWRAHSKNIDNTETISADQTFQTLSSGGVPSGNYHAPPATSTFTVNVRDTGATGNGVTNDTVAIQAAVNQVAGTGGTVLVPAGTYLVSHRSFYPRLSIDLGSNMTFKMEPGAIIKQAATTSGDYVTLYIGQKTNVNVVGGVLQGERAIHIPQTYNYANTLDANGQNPGGEYGFGIWVNVQSSNVYIDGVTAQDYWGDGFTIGGAGGGNSHNVNFYNCVATRNRRLGMAVMEVIGGSVRNCTFSYTDGAWPNMGIDLEPYNAGETVDTFIMDSNTFSHNHSSGIILSGKPGLNNRITLSNNHFDSNGSGYFAAISWANPGVGSTYFGNTFVNSGSTGDIVFVMQ